MKKYFKLTKNGEIFNGIIENIPENTSYKNVSERIETQTENEKIVLIDEELEEVDIILDWSSIDLEEGFGEPDPDFVAVSDTLEDAIYYKVETEVVYTALNEIKTNPALSISEAMKNAKDKVVYGLIQSSEEISIQNLKD